MILGFWKDIHKEIKNVLGIDFNLDPALYILGIVPHNVAERSLISLLRILLLIAKKTITASWLKPQPPSITEWRERVKSVFIMEKITAGLQLKSDRFDQKWLPYR